eukprot:SAG11_NODE_9352_length_919_cov_2.048780_3_plen_99_part_01
MAFAAFVEALTNGDRGLYMTTQELALDEEDQPALMAPPVEQLSADFPSRPSLLESLVPATYNLWMGAHGWFAPVSLEQTFSGERARALPFRRPPPAPPP